MNKKLAVLSLILSACLSAATVSCDVINSSMVAGYTTTTADINGSLLNTGARIANGIGTSPNAFACPAISAPGNTITGYQVFVTGDYTGGPFGTTTGTHVELMFSAGSGPIAGSLRSLQVFGGNSSTQTLPPVPLAFGPLLWGASSYSAFTVGLDSHVVTGVVGDSSAQVVLSYTVSPEPSSLGFVLLGIGVLSVGWVSLRLWKGDE